jgi:hypothetical protein
MENTNLPRIERAITKLYVPHKNGVIGFSSLPYGLGSYKEVKENILKDSLKVPKGEQIASLLHAAYCNPQFAKEPELKYIRQLMELDLDNLNGGLWVYNQNLCTDKGVYVIRGMEFEEKRHEYRYSKFKDDWVLSEEHMWSREINELEKILNDSKEINNVRVSGDGKVIFVPKGSYSCGEHTPQSLSEDGLIIANYGIEGAKKLGEISSKFKKNPRSNAVKISKGNAPSFHSVTSIWKDWDSLQVGGYHGGQYYSFGVL